MRYDYARHKRKQKETLEKKAPKSAYILDLYIYILGCRDPPLENILELNLSQNMWVIVTRRQNKYKMYLASQELGFHRADELDSSVPITAVPSRPVFVAWRHPAYIADEGITDLDLIFKNTGAVHDGSRNTIPAPTYTAKSAQHQASHFVPIPTIFSKVEAICSRVSGQAEQALHITLYGSTRLCAHAAWDTSPR